MRRKIDRVRVAPTLALPAGRPGQAITATTRPFPAFLDRGKILGTAANTVHEYVDDAAVTTKVKAAFAKDKWVKGYEISVRTDHGVVDLTGNVKTKVESDRATKLATKVKSVSAVHNNLTVGPK